MKMNILGMLKFYLKIWYLNFFFQKRFVNFRITIYSTKFQINLNYTP